MRYLAGLLLALLLLPLPAAHAKAPEPSPEPTLSPTRVPYVGTPSPEAEAMATRVPRGWFSAGGYGLDVNALTMEERLALITALQNANIMEEMATVPVVAGLETSREKPCYIGQRAVFNFELSNEIYETVQAAKITIALREVARGEAGDALVYQMNPLNEPAPQGKEYVVALFDIGLSSENPNDRYTFTTFEFEPVSSKGRVLSYAFITDELSMLDLYAGGNGLLRVTALVDEGTELLFRFSGKIWFSTKVLAPQDAP